MCICRHMCMYVCIYILYLLHRIYRLKFPCGTLLARQIFFFGAAWLRSKAKPSQTEPSMPSQAATNPSLTVETKHFRPGSAVFFLAAWLAKPNRSEPDDGKL